MYGINVLSKLDSLVFVQIHHPNNLFCQIFVIR